MVHTIGSSVKFYTAGVNQEVLKDFERSPWSFLFQFHIIIAGVFITLHRAKHMNISYFHSDVIKYFSIRLKSTRLAAEAVGGVQTQFLETPD